MADGKNVDIPVRPATPSRNPSSQIMVIDSGLAAFSRDPE
jgi:hypothetical protein